MMIQDASELTTQGIFAQSSVRDPGADGHDFNCEDSNLAILISSLVYVLVDVAEEVDVRVESDAYAMDKDDRKTSGRGVRTVPVREMRDWRALCRSESNWAKGEERKEAA